jgi:hypothetical protein
MTRVQAEALPLREPAAGPAGWQEGQVAQALGEARLRLEDGRLALQSPSCLLAPAAGDRVLLWQGADALYVLHVLARQAGGAAHVGVPQAESLCIHQARVEVSAPEGVTLRSLRDVDLVSADGSVSLVGRHVVASAAETLVHNAHHFVAQLQHCVVQVRQLLRLHGQQAIVTADEDMKLDAERISLG